MSRTPAVVADEGFDVFWMQYPRREAKKDALKAFQKLAPAPDVLDAMLKAIAWQRETPSWTRDGGRYIPLPASWIRGRRWEDEPFHPPPEVSERTRKIMRAAEEFLR